MQANPQLTASQQKQAAAVLSRAFSRDPFMSYVFPNAQTREQKLAALFQPVIRCSQRYGGVEITAGGEGVLGWLSGEHFPLGGDAARHNGDDFNSFAHWVTGVSFACRAMKKVATGH